VRDFTIAREERYEEPFVVPPPEAVVFEGRYESTGTTARQGLCWTVGKGRVFYFRPGHETYPVYRQAEVRRILRNAALWAAGDDAAIWEDADPSAKAARAAGEPPLAVILRDLGYGGTDVTTGGELSFGGLFARAKPGAPVSFTPLAAYGTLKTTRGGWYRVKGDLTDRVEMWRIEGPENKRMRPPLMPGGKTAFAPGGDPFGLWIASESFPGEVIHTEDRRQAAIARFGKKLHKSHVYAAVRGDGTPVPDAVCIGFEYSTNDDNQEVVALVENVRPLSPPDAASPAP
ncbi:MAG TPA: ThuA domain-containing protein, partial [Armatimonadaceae bacterium]|nr:ThuA domain-containing protein [Armatimonadaceae bacterium]